MKKLFLFAAILGTCVFTSCKDSDEIATSTDVIENSEAQEAISETAQAAAEAAAEQALAAAAETANAEVGDAVNITVDGGAVSGTVESKTEDGNTTTVVVKGDDGETYTQKTTNTEETDEATGAKTQTQTQETTNEAGEVVGKKTTTATSSTRDNRNRETTTATTTTTTTTTSKDVDGNTVVSEETKTTEEEYSYEYVVDGQTYTTLADLQAALRGKTGIIEVYTTLVKTTIVTTTSVDEKGQVTTNTETTQEKSKPVVSTITATETVAQGTVTKPVDFDGNTKDATVVATKDQNTHSGGQIR